jgi:hypothetical protein
MMCTRLRVAEEGVHANSMFSIALLSLWSALSLFYHHVFNTCMYTICMETMKFLALERLHRVFSVYLDLSTGW